MSQLFNNKYYNQLFGGKKEEEQQQKKRQQKSQQKSQQKKQRQQQQRQQKEQDDSSMSTEDTRQRLERIFGGAKGKKGSAKPKVAAARKSDAQVLAEGKVKDAGKKDGKQVFEFKNGALAVRDAKGRFVIVKGVSKDKMKSLRARRTGPKAQRISTGQAKKAFSAYWNRKMRDAASHNSKHGLKGRKSHKAAVKRSKSYHMKYAHKNPARHLSPESDKGYLYLRKERVLRDASGMPSRNKKGSVRVRRAGPAIYDFIGVAPEVLQMSKRKGSRAAIMHARKSLSKKSKKSKKSLKRKSASTRKSAMKAARKELRPSPAKRVAKSASKKASSSKKARKTRSNAGKPRGPRKSASKKSAPKKSAPKVAQHIRFGSSSKKSSSKKSSARKSARKSSSKKARKTRSNAGKPRGSRKGKASATVVEM
jgi:hypothetical protein